MPERIERVFQQAWRGRRLTITLGLGSFPLGDASRDQEQQARQLRLDLGIRRLNQLSARATYRHHREIGDLHSPATHHLLNKLLGQD